MIIHCVAAWAFVCANASEEFVATVGLANGMVATTSLRPPPGVTTKSTTPTVLVVSGTTSHCRRYPRHRYHRGLRRAGRQAGGARLAAFMLKVSTRPPPPSSDTAGSGRLHPHSDPLRRAGRPRRWRRRRRSHRRRRLALVARCRRGCRLRTAGTVGAPPLIRLLPSISCRPLALV